MKRFIRLIPALFALAALQAAAQNYPARSINLIVPFAAGGPSDALARVIGQAMSATLGQQIAIDNVTGAGGTLAAAKGAQARPDGYTLLLAHIGQSASVTLYRKLQYDPVGAFDTIGLIAEVPMVIVCFIFWIGWHYLQMRMENQTLEEEARRLAQQSSDLQKALQTERLD